MLFRNIDTQSRLVNGALGTMMAIKAHQISVQFDAHTESQEQMHERYHTVSTFAIIPYSGELFCFSWFLSSTRKFSPRILWAKIQFMGVAE